MNKCNWKLFYARREHAYGSTVSDFKLTAALSYNFRSLLRYLPPSGGWNPEAHRAVLASASGFAPQSMVEILNARSILFKRHRSPSGYGQ